MSKRYFLASGCIQQGLFPFDALAEVGVAEACRRDQIDGPREQRLQALEQREVRVRVLSRRTLTQIDKEIEIARVVAAQCRAEELETAHAEFRADDRELGAMRIQASLENGVQGRPPGASVRSKRVAGKVGAHVRDDNPTAI